MRTTEKEALQAGLSREAFIEPIPLDRQPPIKCRYIWNMPPKERPSNVTAQEVKEMKARHDKQLREKRKAVRK
jgi:hypothetical protein